MPLPTGDEDWIGASALPPSMGSSPKEADPLVGAVAQSDREALSLGHLQSGARNRLEFGLSPSPPDPGRLASRRG